MTYQTWKFLGLLWYCSYLNSDYFETRLKASHPKYKAWLNYPDCLHHQKLSTCGEDWLSRRNLTVFSECKCLCAQVIAATNRVDILDPALLRSGRLDRKIEFPHPDEEARARIMQIHSRKMNVSPDVNFEELSRSTDDFNGAQCKAVCVEAVRHFRNIRPACVLFKTT